MCLVYDRRFCRSAFTSNCNSLRFKSAYLLDQTNSQGLTIYQWLHAQAYKYIFPFSLNALLKINLTKHSSTLLSRKCPSDRISLNKCSAFLPNTLNPSIQSTITQASVSQSLVSGCYVASFSHSRPLKIDQALVFTKKEKEGTGFKAIGRQKFPSPLFPPPICSWRVSLDLIGRASAYGREYSALPKTYYSRSCYDRTSMISETRGFVGA